MSGGLTAGTSAEQLLAARRRAVESRPSVDLRVHGWAVGDQGQRPLCVTFAVSLIHHLNSTSDGTSAGLAPEPLWSHCLNAGEAGWDGTSIAAASQALASDGQTSLSVWPYNDSLGAGTEAPPVGAGEAPWQTAALSLVDVANDGVEIAIENSLAQGEAVVLVIEIDDSFESVDPNGLVRTPPVDASPGYYHAVAVMGAATVVGQRCLLIENSWGSSWGYNGHAWLPTSYLIAFGEAAAAIA